MTCIDACFPHTAMSVVNAISVHEMHTQQCTTHLVDLTVVFCSSSVFWVTRFICRWVEAAGGSVHCSDGVEVSPLASYSGENLEQHCKGKTFEKSFVPELQC